MDQCYINLAIVHHHPQEGDGYTSCGDGDSAHVSSPASLFTRLQIKERNEGTHVPLSTIFDSRKGRDGHEKQHIRILVRGVCSNCFSIFSTGPMSLSHLDRTAFFSVAWFLSTWSRRLLDSIQNRYRLTLIKRTLPRARDTRYIARSLLSIVVLVVVLKSSTHLSHVSTLVL